MEVRDEGAVLLTGATGFVGMEILARYLERTDRPVYAPCGRATRPRRTQRLGETLDASSATATPTGDRVVAVPRATSSSRASGSTAARATRSRSRSPTSCIAPPRSRSRCRCDESREINVEGTRRMLELAELCQRRGGLERFSYISTAYVAGTHAASSARTSSTSARGSATPTSSRSSRPSGSCAPTATRLPVQIFRPSIVVGERTTGWTASFNVLYSPLKAFVRGTLPALPGAALGAGRRRARRLRGGRGVRARRSDPVDGSQHLPPGRRAAGDHRRPPDRALGAHLGRREPPVIPPGSLQDGRLPVLVRSSGKLRRGLERSKVFFPYFSMDVALRRTSAPAAGSSRPGSARRRSRPTSTGCSTSPRRRAGAARP